MRKIGILTLPIVDNYGGILQATALYGYLKENGYDPVFLRNDSFDKVKKWKQLALFVLKLVPFQNIRNVRKSSRRAAVHERFINRYIPVRTDRFDCRPKLMEVVLKEKFDAVVVGSDQVWRWDYIKDDYRRYFLDFVDRNVTRKIAYAASFGKSVWQEPRVQEDISRLLADFDAVSTRESDGVTLCEEFGRRDCQHVLDPTLLVGASFYDVFCPSVDSAQKGKTLLTYVLDDASSKDSFVSAVLSSLGADYVIRRLGIQSECTVPEWVDAFRRADFVITDSFHGMVFSVLFNKPFLAIGNQVRGGSRFTSFLNQFGLSDRLIDESSLSGRSSLRNLETQIDYMAINKKLVALRRSSHDFLIKSIEGVRKEVV